MAALSHRERVLRAVKHQKPDRVPIDLGSSPNTTIVRIAYENLRRYLGLCLDVPVNMMGVAFQTVTVDEPILEFLGIDTRPVIGGKPDNDRTRLPADEVFVDEWGVARKAAYAANGSILYYDMIANPLAGATNVDAIEGYA